MKTVSLKNYKKSPKTLYSVVINMGGLVHKKVYELYKGENSHYPSYYDKEGNEGFSFGFNDEQSFKIGLNKKSSGYWFYLSDSKQDAQNFLDGAKSVVDFMGQLWFN